MSAILPNVLLKMVARYRAAGLDVGPRDYAAAIGTPERRVPAAQLRRQLARLRPHERPAAEASDLVEMMILAGDPDWAEWAIRLIVLPVLAGKLQRGGPAVAEARAWSGDPQLKLVLQPNHLRALAAAALPDVTFATRDRVAELLALWKPLSATPIEWLDPRVKRNVGRIPPEYLWHAVRLWDTAETAPALLALLLDESRRHEPSLAGFLIRLVQIRRLLGLAQPAEQRMADLRASVAAALNASTDADKPLTGSRLHALLPRLHRLRRMLDSSVPHPGVATWYEAAAHYVEQLPHAPKLRHAWASDVAAWAGGLASGARLVRKLYGSWFDDTQESPPGSDAFEQWVRAAPPSLAHVVRNAVLAEFAEKLASSSGMLGKRLPATLRMVRGCLPSRHQTLLLGKWLNGWSSPLGKPALQAFATSTDATERAIGECAGHLTPERHQALVALLWEIVLSPPRRRRWLRMSLQGRHEAAVAVDGGTSLASALAAVLRALDQPLTGPGKPAVGKEQR